MEKIGFLFDLDCDNVDELVLFYALAEDINTLPIHAFDVYDVENGQLRIRAQNIKIDFVDVGGSSGDIGVEYYNGIPVLAAYTRNGCSSCGEYVCEATYEVNLYDCNTYSMARSISVDVYELDDEYTIAYTIAGKEVSAECFHQEITQYTRIALEGPESYSYLSWDYEVAGVRYEQKLDLDDLLCYLQQIA